MFLNAIRLWNEKAHQMTGMSLAYNYERENKLFLEEYCEFVEWKTEADKLDAIADMFFLLEWMLSKDEWEDYESAEFHKQYRKHEVMAQTCLASMDSVDNEMVIDLAVMEVIKANNTRFGEGCYKNKDGKFIKSPDYKQPDLDWIVELYNVSFTTLWQESL